MNNFGSPHCLLSVIINDRSEELCHVGITFCQFLNHHKYVREVQVASCAINLCSLCGFKKFLQEIKMLDHLEGLSEGELLRLSNKGRHLLVPDLGRDDTALHKSQSQLCIVIGAYIHSQESLS